MKKIYLICAAICSLVGYQAHAQQDAVYNMYMFNGLYINPAYAGSNNMLNLVGIYRHQWVGMPGAPRTFNISADSPLKREQYALGATISNDKIGLSNAFSFTPAFAYRPRIGKVRLSIGIQASFTYFSVRNDNAILVDEQPDAVYANNVNLFVPNIGFGFYLSDLAGKRFYVGLSAPHLLPYSLRNSKLEGYNFNAVAKLYNFYTLTAGYVVGKQYSVVKFIPSFLVMYQQGVPKNIPDFHINAMLVLFDRVKVGASYRTGGDKKLVGQAIVGMIEAKLTRQLRIGYAYDTNLSRVRVVNKGSHEIMLGYDFMLANKRVITPRYGRYF